MEHHSTTMDLAASQDLLSTCLLPTALMAATDAGTFKVPKVIATTQPTTPAEPLLTTPPVTVLTASSNAASKKRVQITAQPDNSISASNKRLKPTGNSNDGTAAVDGGDDEDSSSLYMMPTAARRPRMTDGLTAEQFEHDMLEIESELDTMGKSFQLPATLAEQIEQGQPVLMKYWNNTTDNWPLLTADAKSDPKRFLHDRMIAMSSVYLIPKSAYAQYKLDHPNEDPVRLQAVVEQARIEAKTRKPLGADDIRFVDDEADYNTNFSADSNNAVSGVSNDADRNTENFDVTNGDSTRTSSVEPTVAQAPAQRSSRRLLLNSQQQQTSQQNRRAQFGYETEKAETSTAPKTTNRRRKSANTVSNNKRRTSRRSAANSATPSMRPPADPPAAVDTVVVRKPPAKRPKRVKGTNRGKTSGGYTREQYERMGYRFTKRGMTRGGPVMPPESDPEPTEEEDEIDDENPSYDLSQLTADESEISNVPSDIAQPVVNEAFVQPEVAPSAAAPDDTASYLLCTETIAMNALPAIAPAAVVHMATTPIVTPPNI